MGAIVFASTWGKYHFDRSCYGLRTAQNLTDWACEDYCVHDHPKPSVVKRMSDTKARLDGKHPCLKCVPKHLRTFDSPDETFGHEPVDGHPHPDVCRLVCARCIVWTRWSEGGIWIGRRVTWPCSSAVVLGLVPREKEA